MKATKYIICFLCMAISVEMDKIDEIQLPLRIPRSTNSLSENVAQSIKNEARIVDFNDARSQRSSEPSDSKIFFPGYNNQYSPEINGPRTIQQTTLTPLRDIIYPGPYSLDTGDVYTYVPPSFYSSQSVQEPYYLDQDVPYQPPYTVNSSPHPITLPDIIDFPSDSKLDFEELSLQNKAIEEEKAPCINSQVVQKILSRILILILNVMNSSNPKLDTVNKVLSVLETQLKSGGLKNQDLYIKLQELENILQKGHTLPNSYKPNQGRQLIFNENIPNINNPDCKAAFLKVMTLAYDAYLQASKYPNCNSPLILNLPKTIPYQNPSRDKIYFGQTRPQVINSLLNNLKKPSQIHSDVTHYKEIDYSINPSHYNLGLSLSQSDGDTDQIVVKQNDTMQQSDQPLDLSKLKKMLRYPANNINGLNGFATRINRYDTNEGENRQAESEEDNRLLKKVIEIENAKSGNNYPNGKEQRIDNKEASENKFIDKERPSDLLRLNMTENLLLLPYQDKNNFNKHKDYVRKNSPDLDLSSENRNAKEIYPDKNLLRSNSPYYNILQPQQRQTSIKYIKNLNLNPYELYNIIHKESSPLVPNDLAKKSNDGISKDIWSTTFHQNIRKPYSFPLDTRSNTEAKPVISNIQLNKLSNDSVLISNSDYSNPKYDVSNKKSTDDLLNELKTKILELEVKSQMINNVPSPSNTTYTLRKQISKNNNTKIYPTVLSVLQNYRPGQKIEIPNFSNPGSGLRNSIDEEFAANLQHAAKLIENLKAQMNMTNSTVSQSPQNNPNALSNVKYAPIPYNGQSVLPLVSKWPERAKLLPRYGYSSYIKTIPYISGPYLQKSGIPSPISKQQGLLLELSPNPLLASSDRVNKYPNTLKNLPNSHLLLRSGPDNPSIDETNPAKNDDKISLDQRTQTPQISRSDLYNPSINEMNLISAKDVISPIFPQPKYTSPIKSLDFASESKISPGFSFLENQDLSKLLYINQNLNQKNLDYKKYIVPSTNAGDVASIFAILFNQKPKEPNVINIFFAPECKNFSNKQKSYLLQLLKYFEIIQPGGVISTQNQELFKLLIMFLKEYFNDSENNIDSDTDIINPNHVNQIDSSFRKYLDQLIEISITNSAIRLQVKIELDRYLEILRQRGIDLGNRENYESIVIFVQNLIEQVIERDQRPPVKPPLEIPTIPPTPNMIDPAFLKYLHTILNKLVQNSEARQIIIIKLQKLLSDLLLQGYDLRNKQTIEIIIQFMKKTILQLPRPNPTEPAEPIIPTLPTPTLPPIRKIDPAFLTYIYNIIATSVAAEFRQTVLSKIQTFIISLIKAHVDLSKSVNLQIILTHLYNLLSELPKQSPKPTLPPAPITPDPVFIENLYKLIAASIENINQRNEVIALLQKYIKGLIEQRVDWLDPKVTTLLIMHVNKLITRYQTVPTVPPTQPTPHDDPEIPHIDKEILHYSYNIFHMIFENSNQLKIAIQLFHILIKDANNNGLNLNDMQLLNKLIRHVIEIVKNRTRQDDKPQQLPVEHSKSRIVEITYKVETKLNFGRTGGVVKYTVPYNIFIANLRDLLLRKPILRPRDGRLENELTYASNITQVSPELQNIPKSNLIKLITHNGSFVEARIQNADPKISSRNAFDLEADEEFGELVQKLDHIINEEDDTNVGNKTILRDDILNKNKSYEYVQHDSFSGYDPIEFNPNNPFYQSILKNGELPTDSIRRTQPYLTYKQNYEGLENSTESSIPKHTVLDPTTFNNTKSGIQN